MLAKITKPKVWNSHRYDNWEKLWSDITEGDRDSLSELYCYSYVQLFNYGFKIVPEKGLVQDCIQELFLNIWSTRNRISEARSVKSYLFSSLRRIILRRIKKNRNRARRNHDYSLNMFEEMYNIEDVLIHFETEYQQKVQLGGALESLSKRQREAVYLKFYNGLSNKEISEVMDVNKQSVYNHISKAIQKMQDFVQA